MVAIMYKQILGDMHSPLVGAEGHRGRPSKPRGSIA